MENLEKKETDFTIEGKIRHFDNMNYELFYLKDEKEDFKFLFSSKAVKVMENLSSVMQEDLNEYEKGFKKMLDELNYVYIEFDPNGSNDIKNFESVKHQKDVVIPIFEEYLKYYDADFDANILARKIEKDFNYVFIGTAYYFYELTGNKLDNLVAEAEVLKQYKNDQKLLIEKLHNECNNAGFTLVDPIVKKNS